MNSIDVDRSMPRLMDRTKLEERRRMREEAAEIERINAILERSIWRKREDEYRRSLGILNACFVAGALLILGYCALQFPAKHRADLAMYEQLRAMK